MRESLPTSAPQNLKSPRLPAIFEAAGSTRSATRESCSAGRGACVLMGRGRQHRSASFGGDRSNLGDFRRRLSRRHAAADCCPRRTPKEGNSLTDRVRWWSFKSRLSPGSSAVQRWEVQRSPPLRRSRRTVGRWRRKDGAIVSAAGTTFSGRRGQHHSSSGSRNTTTRVSAVTPAANPPAIATSPARSSNRRITFTRPVAVSIINAVNLSSQRRSSAIRVRPRMMSHRDQPKPRE